MSFTFDKSQEQISSGKKNLFMVSKRVFDILFCVACLPIFVVLCAVIWVANLVMNPGPLIFTQMRRGKDGKPFKIYKFRSMAPATSEMRVRNADDPLEVDRVTSVGHILRKSQMDELPQIINVLLGDMSVVGPRPEIFEFAETYSKIIPDYTVRERIRPGITGHAQVTQGYTESIEMIYRKTELDTFYVHNMSWSLEARILFLTGFKIYGFARRK